MRLIIHDMNSTIIVITLEINSATSGMTFGVFVITATMSANSAKKNPITGTKQNSSDKKLTDHANVDTPFVFWEYSRYCSLYLNPSGCCITSPSIGSFTIY